MSYSVGGGESGYIAPHPTNPNIFYAGSQGALLTRFDRRTGYTRDIQVYPLFFSGESAGSLPERWQWTFPIVFSPLESRRCCTPRRSTSGRPPTTGIAGRRSAPTSRATIQRRSAIPAARSRTTRTAPRSTARSSPSRPRAKRRTPSGPAPTTAWCTSRATAARTGRTSRRRACRSSRASA